MFTANRRTLMLGWQHSRGMCKAMCKNNIYSNENDQHIANHPRAFREFHHFRMNLRTIYGFGGCEGPPVMCGTSVFSAMYFCKITDSSPTFFLFTHHLLTTMPMESWVKCLSQKNTFGVSGVNSEVTGGHFFRRNKTEKKHILPPYCSCSVTFKFDSKRRHLHWVLSPCCNDDIGLSLLYCSHTHTHTHTQILARSRYFA